MTAEVVTSVVTVEIAVAINGTIVELETILNAVLENMIVVLDNMAVLEIWF